MAPEELFAFETPVSDDSRRQLLALLNAKSSELTWQHARELFRDAFSGDHVAEGHFS